MNRLHKLAMLALVILSAGLCSCQSKEDTGPLVVVTGAKEVEVSHYHGNDTVTYRVEKEYPANDVIEEIVGKMEQQGWQPLSEDYLNPGKLASLKTGWRKTVDPQAHPNLTTYRWVNDWHNNTGDVIRYVLTYHLADGARVLKDLNVDVAYTPASVVKEVQNKLHFIEEHQKKK